MKKKIENGYRNFDILQNAITTFELKINWNS